MNPFDQINARFDAIESLLLDVAKAQRQPEIPPRDELFDVEKTAKFLNLTPATIYSKVSKGELPNIKRGKRLYFSRDELIKYLHAGRRKTNAEIEATAAAHLKTKKGGRQC